MNYILEVLDGGTVIGRIEALSMESLLEQTHKIENIVKEHEEEPTGFEVPQDPEDELGNNGEPKPESAEDGREPDELPGTPLDSEIVGDVPEEDDEDEELEEE